MKKYLAFVLAFGLLFSAPAFAAKTGPSAGTITLPANGGTGLDSSAQTGVAQVNGGTWSWSTALATGTVLNIGTSASATNPQRSGQAGTGLFSDTTNQLKIAANGSTVATFLSTGLSVNAVTVTSTTIPSGFNGLALFNDPLAVANLPSIYDNGAAVPVMTFTNDLAGSTPKNYIACENGGNNTAPGCHIVTTDGETNVGFFMQPLGNAQFWITSVDSQTTVGATNSGIMLQNEDTTAGNTMAIYNVNANFSGTLNGQNAEIVFKNESQSQQTGSMYFMTSNNGAPVTAMTIDHSRGVTMSAAVLMPGIASSTAAQTGTMCRGTSGNVTYDPSLGCLSSREDLKKDIVPLSGALHEIMQLQPVTYLWKDKPEDQEEQLGLVAEKVAAIDGRLVGYDDQGQVRGVRYQQAMVTLALSAIQEQQREIYFLQAFVYAMALMVAGCCVKIFYNLK